jgi:hypothetical protein
MKIFIPCATKRNYYGDEKIKSMVAYKIDAISIGNFHAKPNSYQENRFDKPVQVL